MHVMLGSPITAIAVIASVSATLTALSRGRPTLTALLSTASAGVIGMRVALRPDHRAEIHRGRSQEYLALGADAIDFAEIDLFSGMDIEALINRRDALMQRLDRLRADDRPGILPFVGVAALEARQAVSRFN